MTGYRFLADAVLLIHLLWILWVIFGALFTGGRPVLTAIHLGSLVWGLAVELGPWPCPLTWVEEWALEQAGLSPYEADFLTYYLERMVYPDIPAVALGVASVVVVGLNGLVYWRRFMREPSPGRAGGR